MSCILDASLTFSWCFEDERSPLAMRALTQVAGEGAAAPAIWLCEVANALLVAMRRGRILEGDALHFLALLEKLPIEIDPGTQARYPQELVALASSAGLSVYDAAYLELARRKRLPLATLDENLHRAAKAHGVKLLA